MKDNEALDKVITEALINVEVTHPPLLELAKKKFTGLANNQKDGDILTLINEWAKTKDIDNYILAPNNSGGGALGNRGNYSYVDKHSPANWDLWAYIPQCEHWKAVALSLDIEPPENSYQVKGWPLEYDRRLKITSAHIECKSLPRSKTDFNKVDLSVFSTWAQSLDWSLPDRFPRVVEVKKAPATPIEVDHDELRVTSEALESLLSRCEVSQQATNNKDLTLPVIKAEPATAKNKVSEWRKLNRNELDPAIDEAIKLAGNMELADVFLKLKDLAISEFKPFTGLIEGSSLCYTNSDDKPDKFSKNALGKRLKIRRDNAV